MNIRQVPADPNNYSKTKSTKQGIVFHWIVGELSSADRTFKDPDRKASAHYGVGSRGAVHQYVQDEYIAWHAGNSSANIRYIGIEHAGGQLKDGKRKKPTTTCHETSIELCVNLCVKHGFTLKRGVNAWLHKEISDSPTSCPGTLDVDYIVQQVNKRLNFISKFMQKLQDAKNWNNKIKNKKLLKDRTLLYNWGNYSKLINKIDDIYMGELIIKLHELSQFIRSRPGLKNNERTEIVMERFAAYIKKSLGV
ncbi:hypothetical protein GF362_00750 [Candidatus Dojkabacteria bacterium]|nr:hypothetical protein [Candidatus Dojkabacteria bacterium]